eukprot:365939-Chlamydomonas_euryale.AAC.9
MQRRLLGKGAVQMHRHVALQNQSTEEVCTQGCNGHRRTQGIWTDGVDTGCVDVGGLDAGVLTQGVWTQGGLDRGSLDAGGVDAGGVDAGGVDTGVLDTGIRVEGCRSQGSWMHGAPGLQSQGFSAKGITGGNDRRVQNDQPTGRRDRGIAISKHTTAGCPSTHSPWSGLAATHSDMATFSLLLVSQPPTPNASAPNPSPPVP